MSRCRTRFALGAAFLILSFLGFACTATSPVLTPSSRADATSEPAGKPLAPTADPSTLRIALTANVADLEFPYASETTSQNATRTLYDSLLFLAPDGSIQPALAESWEMASDGRSYIFHLRHDVSFQNGEPFNADAVVFTWNTYRQDDVPFSLYFKAAQTVAKIDDYTVQVTTAEPTALLLSYIAVGWAQIPPGYYQQVGRAGFAQWPIGTGPYMVVEWVKGDHLTVKANPNYWRKGKPLVERVVFQFIPESEIRTERLKKGELDIAPRLGPEEAESLKNVSGVSLIHYPVDRVFYVAFNNLAGDPGPIRDKRVRLAMNYAVDRQGIVRGLLGGSAQLASGFVGPADLGWDGGSPYPYDPDKAKQLLSEAGYADGFNVEMSCPNRVYSHLNEVCEAVVRYLDKVGIQVHLQLIESNAFWELERTRKLPPLFADAWASTYGEAFNRIQGTMTQEGNFASWYDPLIQDKIDEIGHTIDPSRRADLYRQLQQMLRDDPPFIYLYYPETYEAISARVTGYQPRASEDYYLWDVGLKNPK